MICYGKKNMKTLLKLQILYGTLAENQEDYHINMWVSLDPDLLINVTPNNANDIIRYLYERYPY